MWYYRNLFFSSFSRRASMSAPGGDSSFVAHGITGNEGQRQDKKADVQRKMSMIEEVEHVSIVDEALGASQIPQCRGAWKRYTFVYNASNITIREPFGA